MVGEEPRDEGYTPEDYGNAVDHVTQEWDDLFNRLGPPPSGEVSMQPTPSDSVHQQQLGRAARLRDPNNQNVTVGDLDALRPTTASVEIPEEYIIATGVGDKVTWVNPNHPASDPTQATETNQQEGDN